jgi:FSR family fosmidomycin resistance protein-like MFS transporter
MTIRSPDPSRSALWLASLAHFLNDGLTAAVTTLLPFIAADLTLSYSQAGAVKSALSGAISLSQLPAGFLATYAGEAALLGLGLGWFSLSFLLASLARGHLALLLLMGSAGIGGGAYHPVGTAWVSRVFMGGRRGAAVGTLNFSGDVGKAVMPALAGGLVAWVGWRGSLGVVGIAGAIVAGALLLWGRLQHEAHPSGLKSHRATSWGIRQPGQFALITVISLIDGAGRAAVSAFLGFLLLNKGQPESALGWLIALTFAGGAFGKFGCGLLTDRFEDRRVIALTETAMAIGCLLLAFVDPGLLLAPLLLAFGFALNGTSSVIYIRLADTLQPDNLSRGYGLHYALHFGSAAAAPVLYGLLADWQGINWVYVAVAAMNLSILPLVTLLRSPSSRATPQTVAEAQG